MKNFFNIVAPIYEKTHWSTKKSLEKLGLIADFQSADTVIDIGGGTGRIARSLIDKVRSITVIDSSLGMIQQCERHAGVSCIYSTAERLPLADKTVDKIIMVDAFHHFTNQALAVREMRRVLVAGGVIIAEEFNPTTAFGWYVALLEKILRMGSIFHNPSSLKDLFTKNEFTVSIFDATQSRYYMRALKK